MASSSAQTGGEKKAPLASQNSMTTAQGLNEMAFRLLGGLSCGRDKCNLVFSPICLAVELACLVEGSEGETKAQLQRVLRVNLAGLEDIIKKFKAEMAEHNFYGAQKVFVNTGIPIMEPFRHLIEKRYMTSAQDVDFKDPKCEYVTEVNEWCQRRTGGKITSVVSKRTVPASSATMLIVSNVFFKGLWSYRFSLNSTQQMNFYLNKDDTSAVRMMVRTGRYAYGEFPRQGIRALEVPYRTANVSMMILLPCDMDGLTGLQELLMKEPNLVQELPRQLRPRTNVRLGLPKFVASVRSKLRGVLEGLGVRAAFLEDQAQFTGISGYKGLCVANVIHTAMIEVAEDGNETPLATSLMTEVVSKVSTSTHFMVDRPFIFYIRSVATDAILFMGCIWQPDQWVPQSPDASVIT